jgi:hypothetical protein
LIQRSSMQAIPQNPTINNSRVTGISIPPP